MKTQLGHQNRIILNPLIASVTGLLLWLPGCVRPNGDQGHKNTTRNQSTPTITMENSGSKDSKKRLEQAIAQYLPQEIGVPIQSVTCPKEIIFKPGLAFDCLAKISEGVFPVKVTVKNSDGQVTLKTQQILLLSEAETKLQQSIKQREGLDMKANCGGKVKIVKKVGETFQCQLTNASGKAGTATMTVTSKEGKVDAKWKI